MAKVERDREDFFREATALVERIEIETDDHPSPIIIGFRKNDALSVYFGSDPVYQFNSSMQVRRCYVDGLLFKADQGQLVAMQRQRCNGVAAMVRMPLSRESEQEICMAMMSQLRTLHSKIQNNDYKLLRCLPEASVVEKVESWLQKSSSIADKPSVC